MATATDITVKKYDGTTDILWSLISASAGDKVPAIWRSGTATGTVGQKPVLSMSSRPNADGTVRRVDVGCKFPAVYTNSTTGQTEVRSVATFSGSFAVPQNMSAVDIQEFAYQLCNLLNVTLMKNTIVAGFAPT
jgi:hypothetical protein